MGWHGKAAIFKPLSYTDKPCAAGSTCRLQSAGSGRVVCTAAEQSEMLRDSIGKDGREAEAQADREAQRSKHQQD